ncbi:hypothetical protein JCM10213_005426 [Rhodosporidiobolus nylandii]
MAARDYYGNNQQYPPHQHQGYPQQQQYGPPQGQYGGGGYYPQAPPQAYGGQQPYGGQPYGQPQMQPQQVSPRGSLEATGGKAPVAGATGRTGLRDRQEEMS